MIRSNSSKIVHQGDPSVADHHQELHNDDEAVHKQKQELKRPRVNTVISQSRKFKSGECNDPHDVHKEQNHKDRVS